MAAGRLLDVFNLPVQRGGQPKCSSISPQSDAPSVGAIRPGAFSLCRQSAWKASSHEGPPTKRGIPFRLSASSFLRPEWTRSTGFGVVRSTYQGDSSRCRVVQSREPEDALNSCAKVADRPRGEFVHFGSLSEPDRDDGRIARRRDTQPARKGWMRRSLPSRPFPNHGSSRVGGRDGRREE